MELGVLFSGGKDSTYAAYLAKEQGHEISCLISIYSKNKESFMFHTPSIEQTRKQADSMNIPLIIQETKGEKEKELEDLKKAIKKAIKKYKIKGVVTGAVESVYQSSRIQKICNELKLECFNPLWKKNQIELLEEIVVNKFKVIIIGVFAYPLKKDFLGREIDKNFIEETKSLYEKYKINPAGEGGEFETFVLDCPLFRKKLKVIGFEDIGGGNSWRREIKIKEINDE
jgi:ABC transporter with metal-binding/Fe-S-binding domain ATP-binding protein